MKNHLIRSSLLVALTILAGCGSNSSGSADNSGSADISQISAGRELFMTETFGNEKFFGDTLGLHTVLNNVAPKDAVALGVQVDISKVPAGIVAVMTGTDLAAKDAALGDPAVTRQLIKAGAVIGVKGSYASAAAADDTLTSVGIPADSAM